MEAPKATYLEDEHLYLWTEHNIELVVERFREERGDLFAHVSPRSSTGDGFLPPDKLNLGSARSIKMYANTLAERGLLSNDEWFDALSQAAALSVKRYREGEPSVVLADVEWRGKPRFLVQPYIDRHTTTILFGDGGVSKSVHALALAVSVAAGVNVLPNSEVRITGPVLYLDWEADEDTHAERLEAICAAVGSDGIEPPANLHYMRRTGSIGSSVREIRREIATREAVFVVVDSVGACCGGDPESAQMIVLAMNAMRAFGVTVLAIHHIAKEAKDKTKPFGSVYAPNLARRTWRLDAEQQAGASDIYVRAINFKANNGRKEESQSHRVAFHTDEESYLEEIVFGFGDQNRMPRSGQKGLKYPVAEQLRDGAKTVKELALALDAREDTVNKTLRRETDWFIKIDRRGDGAIVWGLKSSLDNEDVVQMDMSKPGWTDNPLPIEGVSNGRPVDGEGEDQEGLPW